MEIEYYSKDVYGSSLMYVKDEDQARAITTLTNKKTIGEWDIKAMEKLGFSFTEVLAPRV